jgi:hypothetical protein
MGSILEHLMVGRLDVARHLEAYWLGVACGRDIEIGPSI